MSTLKSVDFPEPFLPKRPMRSPRTNDASTPSYRVWRPKFFRASIRRIMAESVSGSRQEGADGTRERPLDPRRGGGHLGASAGRVDTSSADKRPNRGKV